MDIILIVNTTALNFKESKYRRALGIHRPQKTVISSINDTCYNTAQELCESRDGRSRLPVPKTSVDVRKAALNLGLL